MNKFRDPIHGFIEVSDKELKIVNSMPFQRLRRIKQLGTTYLVYHGAEHTRFGHSLGVMHLVTKSFDSALNNYKETNGKELFDEDVKNRYRQILRLIALVHDLGHSPFSHGSETLFHAKYDHEDYTKNIICNTEISEYINDIGRECNITPELLCDIYGANPKNLSNPEYKISDFVFLNSFLDSELDCDKMDYLLRDSYYCGVNYGTYDVNKFIDSLNVLTEGNNGELILSINKNGLHSFEEFILARYFMFIQVYFHKTRRYLDKMLTDCIKELLPEGKFPISLNEYLNWDDHKVISEIESNKRKKVEFQSFLERRIMTCVYDTSVHYDSNGSDNSLYKHIKKSLKNEEIYIFEDDASKAPHNIIPINLEKPEQEHGKTKIPIINNYSNSPSSAVKESLIIKGISENIHIKRIYVNKNDKKRAKEIIKYILND